MLFIFVIVVDQKVALSKYNWAFYFKVFLKTTLTGFKVVFGLAHVVYYCYCGWSKCSSITEGLSYLLLGKFLFFFYRWRSMDPFKPFLPKWSPKAVWVSAVQVRVPLQFPMFLVPLASLHQAVFPAVVAPNSDLNSILKVRYYFLKKTDLVFDASITFLKTQIY